MVPPGGILVIVDDFRVAGVALRSGELVAEPPPARLWQFNLVPGDRAPIGSGGF